MQQYLSSEALVFSAKKEGSREFEYALPEYLPGISRIIKSTASVEKAVSKYEADQLFCNIYLKVGIIYVSDFGEKIKSIFFDEIISVPMGTVADNDTENVTVPSSYISSVSARPQNPRKFTVSCNYNASTIVLRETNTQMLAESKEDGICTLRETKNLCKKITLSELHCEYSGETTLDSREKSVEEIVYADAVFCGASCTVSDSRIDYEGKFMLHIMYETENDNASENPLYSVVKIPISVKDSIENEKIKSSQQGFVYLDAAQPETSFSFDGYGENRVISFNLKYSVFPVLFEKYTAEASVDAFSEKNAGSPVISEVFVNIHRHTVSDNIRITETIKSDIKDIAQISDCVAKILSVTMEYSESKIFTAAKCLISTYGITKNAELTCSDNIVTLHIPIMQGTTIERSCVPEILLSVHNCAAEIREGALLCTFDISVDGVVTEKAGISVVTSMETDGNTVPKKKNGEITICYPAQNETLWNIAKKHLVNPGAILRANNLENDDISSKHILLIP